MSTTRKPRSRQYAGKSTEERRRERLDKFIEAGIRIIGEQGYQAATLRAVCAEAGLTERYFYESFANREALLIAAYERVRAELAGQISARIGAAAGDAKAMMQGALGALFSYLQAHPARARVLMFEILGVSTEIDAIYRRSVDGFVDMLMSATQPLIKAPAVSPAEQAVMAHGLVGSAIYVAMQWMLKDYAQPLDEVVAGTLQIFIGAGRQLGLQV